MASALRVALLAVLSACATPVLPSGGPPDQAPPVIAASEPAPGAVEVDADRIRITFSEYVDPASFTRALSITPPLDGRIDVAWSGRTAVVRLPEALRPNTTYVLTLDTNLRDVHGVALGAPITLAFSTGRVINQGQLGGQVVEPAQGQGVGGVDVYAYAAPDSVPPLPLPDRPDYRTQTDRTGRFAFGYLAEQPYYVVALRDQNRNRRPDALEPYAVPPRPVLLADTLAADTTQRWILAVADTIPPEPRRVRSFSSRRHAVRFSEPVRFVTRDPSAWTLRDSLSAEPAAVLALYQLPDDPFQIHLLTAPLPPRPHVVEAAAVVDTSGNPARPGRLSFTPATIDDTLGLRFDRFLPDTTLAATGPILLPPPTRPGVRFNQPPDSLLLRALLAVRDTTGQPIAHATTSPDGVTYRITTEPPLAPGQTLIVSVDGARLAGPDTVYTRSFRPLPADELGELSGVVAASDTAATVVVELYPAEGRATAPLRRVTADASGRFVFRELPAGSYRLRLFADRNANARWDGGAVVPYLPAEPIVWTTEPYRVRVRWETALPDTLRLGNLEP